MERIQISAISYLNTAPFVYGLKQSKILPLIDLSFDTPAVCAARLQQKQADIGIVPVAAIPYIADAQIISDYCIGANGAVRTVVINATAPISQIKYLFVDQDSRTSVLLAQLLLKHHWKVHPEVKPLSNVADIDPLSPDTAYVLIGDKVFDYEGQFPYTYDLAAVWKEFRQMPFVFAAWTAVRPLPADFIVAFNQALSFGVSHIQEAIDAHSPLRVNSSTAADYLLTNISYDFDEQKRKALMEFLGLIAEGVGWNNVGR